MSDGRRQLRLVAATALFVSFVLLAGCGGGHDAPPSGAPREAVGEALASRTLTGTVRVSSFAVAAGESVACKGDVTVICQTASVKGTLRSQAVTAPGASGGSITVRADKAIAVSGKIRAGSGVGGKLALHEVTTATGPTNGGNGGSVELVSATGGITLAKGAQVAGGDGGNGSQSLNGGAGGRGGSITLRCVNGTLSLAQGPKLFHVGNGGNGGGGSVQGQDLLTFELPTTLTNGGGDSGALRVFCKKLVGVTTEAASQVRGSRPLLIAVLGEGVADGGYGGNAGAFEYGVEAATGRSTWPALRPGERSSQGPLRSLTVTGADAGDGWERGGDGGRELISGKTGAPNKAGTDAGAVGGAGGNVVLDPGRLDARLLSIAGPRVKVGGTGGTAWAFGGQGGARTSCGLGLPGGDARAQGGSGGDVDVQFPARFRKPGTGGEGRAFGGRGGQGGSCCDNDPPQAGGKGGLGGDAQAWGGTGGNDGQGQGGASKAQGGSGGPGGVGIPAGAGGNRGQAVAQPGRGKPPGKATSSAGKPGEPGTRCPATVGVMTGYSGQNTVTIDPNWTTYPFGAGARAAAVIRDHPQSGQSMVLNGAKTKLWLASEQQGKGRINVYVNPLVGDHQTPNWSLTRTGSDDDPTMLRSLWLDQSRDTLYAIATYRADTEWVYRVLAWQHAGTTGNHAPAREIALNGIQPLALTGDSAHDRLFVAGKLLADNSSLVAVIDSASTRNGALDPNRTLTRVGSMFAIAYDPTRDLLYLGPPMAVAIVKSAASANGPVTPVVVQGNRTALENIAAAFHLFPELDLLLVADSGRDLLAFENAHALSGNAPYAKRQDVPQYLASMVAWLAD